MNFQGAPLKNIHLVCSESSTHFNEIKEASKDLDINTASIGFDPFNNLNEIPQNPKERYQIMTKEMPKGGEAKFTNDVSNIRHSN